MRQLLRRLRVDPRQSLRHLVHLIVVSAVRECGAFLDKAFHPGEHFRMRKINGPGLHVVADGMRPGGLAALRIHRDNPGISRRKVAITADPFALSSISFPAAIPFGNTRLWGLWVLAFNLPLNRGYWRVFLRRFVGPL